MFRADTGTRDANAKAGAGVGVKELRRGARSAAGVSLL
jgi:hypothetical protein